MPTISEAFDALTPPPKKRTTVFVWLLATLCGLVMLYVAWHVGRELAPAPPIRIARDTTFITAPLGPDGLPDYEKWLLDEYRAGITPENNAGVLLYQAIWPGELEEADYQLICDELALSEIPTSDGALQDLQSDQLRAAVKSWHIDQGNIDNQAGVDDNFLDDLLFATIDAPWTTSDLPPLAEWLSRNQKPLDLVVSASLRSRYYLPSPSLLNDEHEMLIEMLLPGVQGARNAARALSIRAMLHLGEGRLGDAWQDTLSLHRLACLASQTQTIVEKLVAIAMHGMANEATLAILGDDRLSADLARRIRSDLSHLDRHVSVHETLRSIERISTLDSVVHASIYGFEKLSDNPVEPDSKTDTSKVDWNVVLSGINYWYDRLEQAIAHDTYSARQQSVDKYESDLDESGREVKHPITLVKAFFSRRARSETIASIFSNLMLPAVSAALAAEERNTSMLQLIDVAAALAVYRAEHGEYPDQLAQLVPNVIGELPVDLYHAKPFIYQRDADGYLLYSTGPNGIDDGGSNELRQILQGRELPEHDEAAAENHRQQIPAGADDLSIRLPVPAFKLPTPPPTPQP